MRGAARAARLGAMAATGTATGTGPAHKRPHPEPAARIGTHDGTFHCDEALACFLLRLLPRYRDAEIVRTRDPQLLAACDVLVDVGGEYDPGRHRYDHHQRSFAESMRSLRPDKPWSTKLSSAGLVYGHFGPQILAALLGQPEHGPVVTALFDKLYENFVEEIDAMDNGIAPAAGEPRYALSTTLSARVGHLNPRWNDPDQDTEVGTAPMAPGDLLHRDVLLGGGDTRLGDTLLGDRDILLWDTLPRDTLLGDRDILLGDLLPRDVLLGDRDILLWDTLLGDLLPRDTLLGDGDTRLGDILPRDILPRDTLPRDTLLGDALPGVAADPRVPRRASGGPWSWWAASSWSGWTSTTGPGCRRGRWWKRPSGTASRYHRAGPGQICNLGQNWGVGRSNPLGRNLLGGPWYPTSCTPVGGHSELSGHGARGGFGGPPRVPSVSPACPPAGGRQRAGPGAAPGRLSLAGARLPAGAGAGAAPAAAARAVPGPGRAVAGAERPHSPPQLPEPVRPLPWPCHAPPCAGVALKPCVPPGLGWLSSPVSPTGSLRWGLSRALCPPQAPRAGVALKPCVPHRLPGLGSLSSPVSPPGWGLSQALCPPQAPWAGVSLKPCVPHRLPGLGWLSSPVSPTGSPGWGLSQALCPPQAPPARGLAGAAGRGAVRAGRDPRLRLRPRQRLHRGAPDPGGGPADGPEGAGARGGHREHMSPLPSGNPDPSLGSRGRAGTVPARIPDLRGICCAGGGQPLPGVSEHPPPCRMGASPARDVWAPFPGSLTLFLPCPSTSKNQCGPSGFAVEGSGGGCVRHWGVAVTRGAI
uniref:MYG1 exonuclease n=1 Tax=Taeniopygia guttata TaxID=59729 RepID=A0A674H1V2_TAEGU